MEITRLRPEQKKQAAGVVAAAFYDYPSIIHYYPDPKRRTRWLPWYMEGVLTCATLFGEVWATEDTSGVLFILPPGHTRLTDRDYVKGGMLTAPLKIGLRHYHVVDECERYLADTQDKLLAGRPHYYLWGLAADPKKQRVGVGRALLRSFLERADAEGLPVYLETHKRENIGYYEQRGFTLIHTDAVPGHDLDFWCFLREAKE